MGKRDKDWANLEGWYSSPRVLQLYDAFATCNIVKNLRRQYIDFVGFHAKGTLTLLELGTGPGHHLEEMLQDAEKWPLNKFIILGVDLSSDCLSMARARVKRASKKLPYPVEFIPIQGSFDQLEEMDLPQPDIAASSLALHHLPWAQKQDFLKFLFGLGIKAVFVGEVDALLDKLPAGSSQLKTNTCSLYKAVFNAVRLESGVTREDALGINKEFFLPEVKKVLEGPYEKREEYFLPAGEWQDLLREAGFADVEIIQSYASCDDNYRLAAIIATAKE